MAPKANSVIPPGYAFLNLETFMSCKGHDMVLDLFEKSANRNPDAFDMYIYNDFYPYAMLDLIDQTLTAAHSKLIAKDYNEAYSILESLTVFYDLDSSWTMCDDGERVKITNKVYGAMVVTLLRTLEKDKCLNTMYFPALETFLRNVAEWGATMKSMSCGPDYGPICKAIGRRLFKNKSPDIIALEGARVEEWINGLDKEDQEPVREKARKNKERDEKKPWYIGGKDSDEHNKNAGFVMSRAWKEYKDYLAGVPKGPMRGPGTWDISKWSTEQRKEFKFSCGEEFDDE